MHETAKRLLELGLARGAKDFTEIARSLGGSDQSATNWKTRGVPKAIIIEAAKKYSVDVGWLSADAQAVEPAFITRWKDGERWVAPVKTQATQKVEQTRNPYLLPSDEQIILDGFRLADAIHATAGKRRLGAFRDAQQEPPVTPPRLRVIRGCLCCGSGYADENQQ